MRSNEEGRFPRDKSFDDQFEEISNIIWYPYVGQAFHKSKNRVMVFGHNAYMASTSYEAKMLEWKARDAWASSECMEEYTYCRGWWTRAFRSFVKGAVGLQRQYARFDENSGPEVTDRVDSFIRRISYLNFIQGLVKSETALVNAEADQVEMSKAINKEFLQILKITHCICWGKQVYQHLLHINGYKILEEKDGLLTGFGTAVIETDGRNLIKVLKTFHPSMPSFRPYSAETQAMLSEFLNDKL